MENKQNTAYYAMMYGLYFGGGLIAFELISYLTKIQQQSFFHLMLVGFVWLVLFTWGIVYSAVDYRKKQLDNFMTYGKAFNFSFLTVFFASFLLAIYSFVVYSWLDPDYLLEASNSAKENILVFYENMGVFDDEVLATMEEQIAEQPDPVSSKAAMNTIFSTAFAGAFVSLITSIFTRKKEQIFN